MFGSYSCISIKILPDEETWNDQTNEDMLVEQYLGH